MSDVFDPRRAPDPATDPLFTVTRNVAVHGAVVRDLRARIAEPGLRDRLRALRVPVLVVRGGGDPIPERVVTELVRLLPQAEYCPIEEVGHTPWLERPERLRAVLRGFLATVAVRP